MPAKIFKTPSLNKAKKYSALVEDFSEKETAEYQSQWEAFNSAKHARSLPGKNYQKLLESFVVDKFAEQGREEGVYQVKILVL